MSVIAMVTVIIIIIIIIVKILKGLSKATTLTPLEPLNENQMADDTKYSIHNVIVLTSYHLLYFFSHLLLVNVCSPHLLMKLHFHF